MLDASTQVEGRAATDIAIEIDRTTEEAGVYPIVLVSYQIACQTYDDKAKAELVKAWLAYVVSTDGQQAAADDAGSAPLSDSLPARSRAVETITVG